MFARFAFNGGASSVLVYGNQIPAKFSSDKKSEWKSLGVEAEREGAKVRELCGDADSSGFFGEVALMLPFGCVYPSFQLLDSHFTVFFFF